MNWLQTWMESHALLLATASVLGAIGMGLLLPGPRRGTRWLGALLASASLGLFAAHVPLLGNWFAEGVFWVLAAVTVGSAVAAMTLKNPVYCAVWFGATLLGTAGLLFFQGAQFLGVATIVVYAGAILVTLLFVLMLANPEGRDAYDRTSWEAPLSAATGVVMVGILTLTVASALKPRYAPEIAVPARTAQDDILHPNHVARLGAELFSRHLVAIEAAGVLLLAALVGAVAIVVHTRGHVGSPARRSGGGP